MRTRRNAGGTSTWKIDFNSQTHSGTINIYYYLVTTTSPDYTNYFYFGYSMLPMSDTQLFLYLNLTATVDLGLIVNSVDLTFEDVNIYAAKYNGYMATMYFLNMGGLHLIFPTLYWRYCKDEDGLQYRPICDKCGSNKYITYYGNCQGSIYIYIYKYIYI